MGILGGKAKTRALETVGRMAGMNCLITEFNWSRFHSAARNTKDKLFTVTMLTRDSPRAGDGSHQRRRKGV